jgi:fibronectin type 3 domain-containing protein
MKFLLTLLTVAVAIHSTQAQDYEQELAVQLSATVQATPPTINLTWKSDPQATGYLVYRKLVGGPSWGGMLANLTANDTTYTDNTVSVGVSYEYRIIKSGTSVAGYGYINSGIELPAVENQGRMILVIDDNFTSSLSSEITQLVADLESDSWRVTQINVSATDAPSAVKTQIINAYNSDPTNTKGLLLLGHVPVPYSGDINPDAHPDHLGAWPADVYYADIDGSWTDNTVNNTVANSARNHNVPSDGKFDQSVLPSDVELEVGRVDFNDLPAFTETEEDLLRAYLDKLHLYKIGTTVAQDRGLYDQGNFASFAEGFAQNGTKNFVPMFGIDQVVEADYLSTLTTDSYMWSYGCGAGSYTSASGVANTNDFAANDIQSIFTMLFGSYFGDWDVQNNLLRAALGSGDCLSSAWAGRPNWQFHHMAMGENIGFSALKTQNNGGEYAVSTLPYFDRWVHITLMGDPSLRMHYPQPPTNLTVSNNNNVADLTWTPSPDISIIGYHIYRRLASDNTWTKLTTAPVTGTTYSDNTISNGDQYYYMVRAVELKTTASGTYYNQSLGSIDQNTFTVGLTNNASLTLSMKLYPNPSSGMVQLEATNLQELRYTISVFSMDGRMVFSASKATSGNQLHQEKLDLTALPKGVYSIQLSSGEHSTMKRLILH